MFRSALSKMITTAFSAGSLAAILLTTTSGMQIAGIGGISPTPFDDIRKAIERGASAEEVIAIGRAHGFEVVTSSVS